MYDIALAELTRCSSHRVGPDVEARPKTQVHNRQRAVPRALGEWAGSLCECDPDALTSFNLHRCQIDD
jgi:hypothetical protein